MLIKCRLLYIEAMKQQKHLGLLISFSAACVSVFFNTQFIDVIQLPKFLILIAGTSLILILALRNPLVDFSNINIRFVRYFVGAFLSLQLISAVINKQNWYEILVGTWGRYNGLITSCALSILLFTAATNKINSLVSTLIQSLTFLGIFFTLYGLLELKGVNFVNQVTQDPFIKLTFGNSNFASIMLVLTSIATLSSILQKKGRLFLLPAIFLQIFLVYKTYALQGWILLALCLTILTGIWLSKNEFVFLRQNSKILLLSLGVFVISLFVLMSKFYSSISFSSLINRIHIWQATIPMLKENLFFGVGQDAFGLWFPKYRSASPLLTDIQTEYYDNAHNIFLNYLANSGIFVFILFLFFTIFVGYHSVLILKYQRHNLDLVSLVCIWFALQAQSLISVDNIALNVWTWIISGVIISASVSYNDNHSAVVKSHKSRFRFNTYKPYRYFLVLPLLFSFLYISPTINLEHKIKFLTSGGGKNLAVTDYNLQVNDIYQKALTARYPEVRNYASVLLYKANRQKEAIDLTLRTTEMFPRSILAFQLLAQMYEKQENVMPAIRAWENALNLDPANKEFERNLLKLKLNSIP